MGAMRVGESVSRPLLVSFEEEGTGSVRRRGRRDGSDCCAEDQQGKGDAPYSDSARGLAGLAAGALLEARGGSDMLGYFAAFKRRVVRRCSGK